MKKRNQVATIPASFDMCPAGIRIKARSRISTGRRIFSVSSPAH